jgi:hypothetical protein
MQLDQISARIRRRTDWEGVDLGFAMARHWFLPLWTLWWLTALPFTLLATALLHAWPSALIVVVWWFKPLYEPLLLFWLSRRLFGEELSVRETLRAWRRALPPRLLANLTVRRLSANRSFYMPVSHLEGLRGKERTKRLNVLRGNRSAGTWLTIGGIHFETALEVAFLLLALYLVPDELMPEGAWALFAGEAPVISWLGDAFSLLAMSVVAPFYVAGGFALYVTRRSELEAWDLELAFRRMAPRFRPASGAAAAVTLVLALALAVPAPRAVAAEPYAGTGAAPAASEPSTQSDQPPPSTAVTPERVREAITQVMDEKEFGEKRQVRYWKYIGKKEPDKKKPEWDFGWVRHLAEALEYALWIGVAVLLGWVLLHLLRLVEWLPRRRTAAPSAKPSVLFGLPVTPDSLPDDVPAAVQALLTDGKLRPALALLYRATLVQLIHAHHLRIPDSATEGECGRIVAARRPAPEADFFSRLTRAWVWCAYGHVAPPPADVALLCDHWRTIYGAARDER